MAVVALYRCINTPNLVFGGAAFQNTWLSFDESELTAFSTFRAALINPANQSVAQQITTVVGLQLDDDLDHWSPPNDSPVLVQGPRGFQGEQGEQGDQGEQGETGADSTVPGPPGTDASTVIDGVTHIDNFLAIGQTPSNVRYEMNSNSTGNVATYDPPVVQIASVDGDQVYALLELFRFKDDPKAAIIQLGKSRGDGIPGSSTMMRPSLVGDRLARIETYGSSNHGFSHASYFHVDADADNTDSNEQAATIHLFTSVARTNGNGLQINSRAQSAFPGPNQAAFLSNSDYGAVLLLGAGGIANGVYDVPPLKFTAGPLTAIPTSGAAEYNSADGYYYLTDSAAKRKRVVLAPALPITDVIQSPAGLTTFQQGIDWVEITVVVGVTDYTAGGTVARVTLSPTVPVNPIVVGSVYGNSLDPLPTFGYFSASNKLAVTMSTGGPPMKAGLTYKFTLMWRLP